MLLLINYLSEFAKNLHKPSVAHCRKTYTNILKLHFYFSSNGYLLG